MTTIYIKDASGQKIAVSVTEEVAAADLETRRAAWRNDSKERYYRNAKMSSLNDCDEEMGCDIHNPEAMLIAADNKAERRLNMVAVLKALTERQLMVLKLLKQGKTKTQIASALGTTKQSVQDIHDAIKKKFKKLL